MIPPERRTDNNVKILQEATSRLAFFQNLAKEPAFEENDVHAKICKRLVAIDHMRGEAVVRRSK